MEKLYNVMLCLVMHAVDSAVGALMERDSRSATTLTLPGVN